MSNDEIMERQIRAVTNMAMPELTEKFKELFGVPAPNTNGKYLRARLIYKLQEIYLGGISAEDLTKLEKLADRDPMSNLKRDLTRNLRNGQNCNGSGKALCTRSRRSATPTQLTRAAESRLTTTPN